MAKHPSFDIIARPELLAELDGKEIAVGVATGVRLGPFDFKPKYSRPSQTAPQPTGSKAA